MFIEELIEKIEEREKNITDDERAERLIEARILDENGYYDARYFRKETVEMSKKANKESINYNSLT